MTDFQQYTLLKQGTSCIIANADSGIQWGHIAADYLLIQALKQNKLHNNSTEIICLLNDRSEIDLLKSIGSTLNPILGNNIKSSSSANGTSSNLKIIPSYSCNSTSEIFKLIKDYTDSTERVNNVVSSNNNNDNNNKNSFIQKRVLFIYSLSELLLLYGLYHAQSLLSQLETICGCQHIIMVLHQAYHSSAFLSHLTSFFTVTAYIQPNDGTLSDEVLIEIQSLRKSINTGKVSESKELFGKSSDTFITPLKKYPSIHHDGHDKSHSTTNNDDSSSVITADSLFIKALALSSSSSSSTATGVSDTTATSNISTSTPAAIVNINNRLITFDSTDPEFDEDSDPDNDLDL